MNLASIKETALDLGFDDLGIASVEGALPFLPYVKDAHDGGRFGPLDYLYRTYEARMNLKSVFPEAQSVIVVVKNYYTGDHAMHSSPEKRPKIARYAWGGDYHHWFKKRLRKLSEILVLAGGDKTWIFNDTGPFLERAWAVKAGLGFLGKSAMFIHRDFGTWTLLGGIATDLILPPSQAYVGPSCGSCTRCMDACPPGALIAPHTLDANRCISTWTIEKSLHKDAFIKAPRDHEWGFGCDICQEVCPWNKFEKVTDEQRFQPIKGRVFLEKATFTQDLRGSALNRTRKPGLKANYLRSTPKLGTTLPP